MNNVDNEKIAKELIDIILKIEKDEAKELNKRSESAIVDKIFREFQKLVSNDED